MSSAIESPLVRRGFGATIAVLLVTGAVTVYLRQEASVVSVDAAVEAFRSGETTPTMATATTTTTIESTPAHTPAHVAGDGASADRAARPDPGAATVTTAPSSEAERRAAAHATQPVSAAPTTPSELGAVREGVYVYDTSGFEETNALGGARHEYPKQTAVTVRNAPCGGWTQRWQPLRERWDESDLCPEGAGPDAISVRRFVTYHEFFQRSQEQEFTCPESSHVFRTSAPEGTTWTWQCTAGSSAIDTKVTVVGREPVVVEGQPIDAVHIHYDSVLTGGNRGRQDQHRWIDPRTGLNLKIVTAIDTEADSPFGPVHYIEKYTITLASTTPRT